MRTVRAFRRQRRRAAQFDWLDALRRIAWPIGERAELELWSRWMWVFPWVLVFVSAGVLALWLLSTDAGIVGHVRSMLCSNADCGGYDYVIPATATYVLVMALVVVSVQ
jgi:ABC-type sugar transport system permease subunit